MSIEGVETCYSPCGAPQWSYVISAAFLVAFLPQNTTDGAIDSDEAAGPGGAGDGGSDQKARLLGGPGPGRAGDCPMGEQGPGAAGRR